MKIALISPKGPLYRYKRGIFKKSLRYQPLTLTTLAALVPSELNATVELFDEGIQLIPDNLDADIVGLTVITGTSSRAYELAKKYRSEGKVVVLGGPHVTLCPDEAQQHADVIVVGYAEYTWPQLLRDFKNNQLKSRYNQELDFSLNNMELPFPDRTLLDKGKFLTQSVFEATRSCAHSCEFCVAPTAWGRKQFQRPVEWVIEDIKRFGQKKAIFIDLNLISDKEYAKELFRQLIPLRIKWYGLSTVLIAHDSELMELVHRSGCAGLLLGLESINPDSLAVTKKKFNNSVDFKQVIAELHDRRIAVQGCFVFGLDTDYKECFKMTSEFAIDNGIDLPRFSILTPFPQTPLFNRLEKEGRILTKNWELYDAQHVVFQPKHMTVEELYDGHTFAWKNTYKYSSILKRLNKADNLGFMSWVVNTGYRYYAYHLDKFYTCDWPLDIANKK